MVLVQGASQCRSAAIKWLIRGNHELVEAAQRRHRALQENVDTNVVASFVVGVATCAVRRCV
jgi:hypothetical protein